MKSLKITLLLLTIAPSFTLTMNLNNSLTCQKTLEQMNESHLRMTVVRNIAETFGAHNYNLSNMHQPKKKDLIPFAINTFVNVIIPAINHRSITSIYGMPITANGITRSFIDSNEYFINYCDDNLFEANNMLTPALHIAVYPFVRRMFPAPKVEPLNATTLKDKTLNSYLEFFGTSCRTITHAALSQFLVEACYFLKTGTSNGIQITNIKQFGINFSINSAKLLIRNFAAYFIINPAQNNDFYIRSKLPLQLFSSAAGAFTVSYLINSII